MRAFGHRIGLALAAAALALGGCAAHGVKASRLKEPALDPPAWFGGETYAYGAFEGVGGNAKLGFSTWLWGRPTTGGAAGAFTLRERFAYDDGARWERTWSFTPKAPGVWRATAQNVVGEGEMTTSGDVARIVYTADMPLKAKTVRLRFDMVLNRVGQGMVINRAFVSKFGVDVGRLTMVFIKPQAAWPEAREIGALPAFPTPAARP